MNSFYRMLVILITLALSLNAGAAPHKKAKKKPLASVTPSIAKDYVPPARTTKNMAETIEFYKHCMYDETDDRIQYAISLNMKSKDDPSLRGTPEKLGYEVCLADALGFKRYENQASIDAAQTSAELVELSDQSLYFPSDVPNERRYTRPWVRDYIIAIARDMNTYFAGEAKKANETIDITQLRVSSTVRSFADQRRQASPAACFNEICSTHTTGAAVDISNHFLKVGPRERLWIKERLLDERKKGKIVMIQEFWRPHFHVLVIPPQFIATPRKVE